MTIPDLIDADCAVLHLLHAGLKGETLAPQLGLSERTLRRRITDLTTRLGATSRFRRARRRSAAGGSEPPVLQGAVSERPWAPVLPQAPAPTHPCPRWS